MLILISTFASAALAFMTFYLSRHKNVHVFIVVGQDVFKWLTIPLVVITINRVLVAGHVFSAEFSRLITGVVYIICVLGVLWSIRRHDRNKQ